MQKNTKKTNQEFINELKIKNPDILPLEEYVNALTKIKCKCLKHNVVWNVTPHDLLSGKGCCLCKSEKISKKNRMSHDDFINKINIINSNVEILSEYQGNKGYVKCRCKLDGYEWETTPDTLISDRCGCMECFRRSERTTHDEFVGRIKNISPNIELIDKYYNMKTKLRYRCKICGRIFSTYPSSLLRGTGCKLCKKATKGEAKCHNCLSELKVDYSAEYSFDDLIGLGGHKLKFDFAVYNDKQLHTLIEYDGEYHYKKLYDNDGHEKLLIHDKMKNKYCKEHDIPLLRIPYWEYEKIDDILTEYINKNNIKRIDN